MACLDWKIHRGFLGFLVIFCAVPLICGLTDPRDIYAINQLYASLGFPPLPGWIPLGGDPCGPPSWLGVECVNANITGITINQAYLGGELSEDLGLFASIIKLDFSNNSIGGSIPSNLPITLRGLFLSDNQFTGQIPETLSSLGQLTDLSLNNNHLTGPIPDAFEPLVSLINMDLSGNNLIGELPPSMGKLSVLTTLHLQNNELTGLLDVLQDLPLMDLNIENNLFSGPIPDKLLSIPSFRKTGNPFNTTVLPPPPTSPPPGPPPSPSEAPSPQSTLGIHVYGPSAPLFPDSTNTEKKNSTNKITWIASAGLVVVIALLLVLCLSMSKCCKKKRLGRKTSYSGLPETHKQDQSSQNRFYQVGKASKKVVLETNVGGSQTKAAFLKHKKDHSVDMTGFDDTNVLPSPLPFPLLSAERIVADPTFTPLTTRGNASKVIESGKLFTIASLQEYTNSFSQQNLIGRGSFGTVYRAHLPDGKVLAVKKLDKSASEHLNDREFLELVSSISKLQHPNIVDLAGYCLEHGQRLLVYNYCRNGTLDEALNFDDEINKKLSWNTRMRLALQAAKALEYLHEVCQPPIVHKNFNCANMLLEDDLTVRVSDCGLAALLPPNSMTRLQSSGYGAPELELGCYSCQSDVYSFGVVMLRLLTGKKSYDRFRPRGEQYLARWALSKLHDIDALSRMVDPSLNGAYPSISLSRVADIISLCIQPEPEFRPPMSEIVQKLLHMIQRDR